MWACHNQMLTEHHAGTAVAPTLCQALGYEGESRTLYNKFIY